MRSRASLASESLRLTSPSPVTQLDGEVKVAEAELGVGQGLHELRCGQPSLPGGPTSAAFLNGHSLTVQPLLPVTHVLGELGEGHVGRDDLQGNKHRTECSDHAFALHFHPAPLRECPLWRHAARPAGTPGGPTNPLSSSAENTLLLALVVLI